ncbi:MAG TPA: choice-of-anchor P family protein [Edaphobacter sp.]|nr:choice-of-anchor P family protein [Edaphobacter sp.]
MNASRKKVFYYHSDAAPIGGYLTKPNATVMQCHGASSLAPAGGQASSRVSNFRMDTTVSFDEAYSTIQGAETTSGSWTTQVTSVVEGLNVLGMVKADRVMASLTIEHPCDGHYAKASTAGTSFENLSIDGVSIDPTLGKRALTPYRKGAFPEMSITDDDQFVARAIEQSRRLTEDEYAPDWLKTRFRWVQSRRARRQKGFVACSLVDKLRGAKAGSSFGHVVVVPEFGNIFLGEMLAGHNMFRLTMIRIEMGCDNEGTMSIGTGDSNGSTMP